MLTKLDFEYYSTDQITSITKQTINVHNNLPRKITLQYHQTKIETEQIKTHTHLCQYSDQAGLPQESGLATHVGATQ